MTLKIAPSILAVWDKSGGDTAAVVAAAKQAMAAGADMLHIDVMDGIYVPAKTFGREMVRTLQGVGELDVHLMVNRPENVVAEYVAAGADRVVFHPSACASTASATAALHEISRLGAISGLAFNVDEDIELLSHIDRGSLKQVLILTVKAGAGGQPFQAEMLKKATRAREILGPSIPIVIDGGVTAQTAAQARAAGATILVAGSAIFNSADIPTAISVLRC